MVILRPMPPVIVVVVIRPPAPALIRLAQVVAARLAAVQVALVVVVRQLRGQQRALVAAAQRRRLGLEAARAVVVPVLPAVRAAVVPVPAALLQNPHQVLGHAEAQRITYRHLQSGQPRATASARANTSPPRPRILAAPPLGLSRACAAARCAAAAFFQAQELRSVGVCRSPAAPPQPPATFKFCPRAARLAAAARRGVRRAPAHARSLRGGVAERRAKWRGAASRVEIAGLRGQVMTP
jgi:hypothetical protein